MKNNEEAEIDALLKSLWERNLPIFQERLNILDRAASAASDGTLAEAARTEAMDIAHKLSGSLGLFGYHQGTEIAREMEQILSSPTPATLSRLNALAAELRRMVMKD